MQGFFDSMLRLYPHGLQMVQGPHNALLQSMV